jgi:hypothetical protein
MERVMDRQVKLEKAATWAEVSAKVKWHSWDSPVGLSIGMVGFGLFIALALTSVGLFLWLLHLANVIH